MSMFQRGTSWLAEQAIGFGIGVFIGQRRGSFAEMDSLLAKTIHEAKEGQPEPIMWPPERPSPYTCSCSCGVIYDPSCKR